MELKNLLGVIYLLRALALLFIVYQAVHAVLLDSSQNAIVVAGQSINFYCSSNITDRSFVWYWSQARQETHIEIYDSGTTKKKFPSFTFNEIESSDSRSCQLTIAPVNMDDGGSVSCCDDEGYGEQKLARLTVLEGHPECTIHNFLDLVKMLCSFRYRGEKILQAWWNLEMDNTPVIPSNKFELINEDYIIEHLTELTFDISWAQLLRSNLRIKLRVRDSPASTEFNATIIRPTDTASLVWRLHVLIIAIVLLSIVAGIRLTADVFAAVIYKLKFSSKTPRLYDRKREIFSVTMNAVMASEGQVQTSTRSDFNSQNHFERSANCAYSEMGKSVEKLRRLFRRLRKLFRSVCKNEPIFIEACHEEVVASESMPYEKLFNYRNTPDEAPIDSSEYEEFPMIIQNEIQYENLPEDSTDDLL